MSVVKVAMSGCLRSGTNYAKALLEQNFECEVKNNIFGWKHGFLPIISSDSSLKKRFEYEGAFFITKNPYSFLVSLFRYHIQVKRNLIASNNFQSFIRSKLIVFDHTTEKPLQLRFSNPIDYWNALNWNVSSQPDFKHVRYEMLLDNPNQTTKKLASKLGLKAKQGDFFVPEKKVQRINDGDIIRSRRDYMGAEDFDKSVYQSSEYMSRFKDTDIACVKSQVDVELLEQLGYTELMHTLEESRQ